MSSTSPQIRWKDARPRRRRTTTHFWGNCRVTIRRGEPATTATTTKWMMINALLLPGGSEINCQSLLSAQLTGPSG